MKLYLNKTSPYARLVMVVAHEKGLTRKIELAWTDPWASSFDLLAANPFSKVPTLLTDDGLPIVDSICICDYLDEVGGGLRLIPPRGSDRVRTLRKYGLGRGLIDAAFGVTIERGSMIRVANWHWPTAGSPPWHAPWKRSRVTRVCCPRTGRWTWAIWRSASA